MSDEPVTRRMMLGATAGLVLVGCSKSTKKWETKKVESNSGVVEIDTKDYPELATPGGMLAMKPSDAKRPVLVMRIEHNQFRVMSLKCPHLGCTVRWDNEEQLLRCPCHGSRFKDNGEVSKGPAKNSLTQYPAETAGTRLRFKVTT